MNQVEARKTVYLVDDHPMLRQSVANLVNLQFDLTVCGEAASLDHALRDIGDQAPDVAIVDISLEGGSGLELIKALKARNSSTAMVVFSMHDEEVYAERCIRAGASAYVMKREPPDYLIVAIRHVLSSKLFVSDKIAAIFSKKFFGSERPNSESLISTLSDQELRVFTLLGEGMANRQVAKDLDVSVKTVNSYCERIKQKLHLSTAKDLLREAIHWSDQSPV